MTKRRTLSCAGRTGKECGRMSNAYAEVLALLAAWDEEPEENEPDSREWDLETLLGEDD
jgi:hypothetical protein